jgi:GAF domain-containing protein
MNTSPSSDSILAQQLKNLLTSVEVTGRAILPETNLQLLQSIVDAAAQIFGAAAASIMLLDESRQHLEFMVAHGAGQDEIIGLRIPVTQGIAGYVVMTGQPIAISKVQNDPRFNQEFARSTGYVPRSLLATPLQYDEQVMGVMEVLDKIDSPTFGMQDMELLGIFARQAAIAIHLGQQVQQLNLALSNGIEAMLDPGVIDQPSSLKHILDDLENQPAQAQQNLVELVKVIRSISSAGEAEQQACLKILSAVHEMIQAKPNLDWSSSTGSTDIVDR